jgi:hypothetical protein
MRRESGRSTPDLETHALRTDLLVVSIVLFLIDCHSFRSRYGDNIESFLLVEKLY